MFRIVFVVFLLGLFAQPASAQVVNATRAFDEGTRLLEQGDFRGAVEAYARSEELGLGSGALFHNRAYAHYRMDELGQAVRYLEKAARLEPEDRFIRHSLEIVSARLEDRFSELPIPIYTRLQRSLVSMISLRVQLLIGLGFYLVFCLLVLMYVLQRWRGAWYRRIRVFSAIIAILFIVSALTSSIWPPYSPEAVVMVDETELYDQPDAESQTVENVHEGLVVEIVSGSSEWTLVQLPNGTRGWVQAQELGAI